MKNKDPAPYPTGAITSKGKNDFKYDKVRIRNRYKCAQSAWPALWRLGKERGWPANGEIDLMGHLNFDDKIYQTVHSEYTHKIVSTVNGKKRLTYLRVPEKGEKNLPSTAGCLSCPTWGIISP